MAVTSSQGIRTISGSGNLDIKSVFLSGAGVPVVTPVTTTETWLYQNTLTGDLYRWSVQSLTWVKFATVPSDIGALSDAPIDGNQYVRQDGAWEQVELPSNGMPVIDPAVANNLVVQLADGTLEDAGYAADENATAGSVVRRTAGGGIVAAGSTDNALEARSVNGSGARIASQNTSHVIFGSETVSSGVVSSIANSGVYTFLGASADANRLAQSNEINAVNYGAAQTLTAPQQAQARANIGAGTMATASATDYVLKAGDIMTGKLSIGNLPPTADDTLFNARRSITGAINSHAYRDESNHVPAGGSVGYAAFDSQYSMAGGASYDHFASFQHRPIFTGSGTITKSVGYWSMPEHTGAGTINSLYHNWVWDTTGGGAITTQYGLYVNSLTAGASNFAIFTAGATPSYFGGLLQAGSNLRVDGLASFGNVAPNNAYQVYVASNLDATKVAGQAVLCIAPVGLGTGTTYATFNSVSAQNNGQGIANNFVHGVAGRVLLQATAANSGARYVYALSAQVSATANATFTATALGMYGLLIDSPSVSGAGTKSFGLLAGAVINNQGNASAPTSYGIKIENQSGSTSSFALHTSTGDVRLMAGAADKIGFHGATPIAQQLLATGAGATVDDVITALQNLGLVRQS